MKSASTQLIDYLNTLPGKMLIADCYTFFLANGQTFRYTAADVPITDADGNFFQCHSVLVAGLKYTIAVGLDVDEQDVTISARETDTINGVPFLQALRIGVFDSCYLQRDRVFLSSWTAPAIGSLTLFHGRFSTIDKIGDVQAQVKVKSDLVLLNLQMPRNMFSPSCLLTFCSAQCGINKAAISVNGAATGGDFSTIQWGSATAQIYDEGTILFLTGANAGVAANIKSSDGANLYLSYPLENEVEAGDTFTATPGCAHTMAACQSFNNLANFRGFPFVPPPETAY